MELRDKNGLTEEEFLAAYAKKNYPRPYLTADIVVIGVDGPARSVLLVRRGQHPYLGRWALPGGFAKADESLEQSAARELAEETGVTGLPLEAVGVFSQPGRDPRGWVVTAAFSACVPMDALRPQAGDDAKEAAWFSLEAGPNGKILLRRGEECLALGSALAFDHDQILRRALTQQRSVE